MKFDTKIIENIEIFLRRDGKIYIYNSFTRYI